MRYAKLLAAAFALLLLAGTTSTGSAQTAQPKPELLLFHPSGPPLAYEVATIKPVDPNIADRAIWLPQGGSPNLLNIRRYIMDAYEAIYQAQVIGGPDWLNKDAYDIKSKIPDDLKAARRKMTEEDRDAQTCSMQQSLLADRFHLKAHFETRVLPVYELVPAKGGLKITSVPAPPEHKPDDSAATQPSSGEPSPPGSMMDTINSNGLHTTNGHTIQMRVLTGMIDLTGTTEVGGRPIVDHTGFTGYFDIKNFTWSPLSNIGDANAPDAPSLAGALEKQLGIKLVPTKDPIEVLVIDSIDRPTPN